MLKLLLIPLVTREVVKQQLLKLKATNFRTENFLPRVLKELSDPLAQTNI